MMPASTAAVSPACGAANKCARFSCGCQHFVQVLVPTVIGKLLRSFSQRVRTFVAAHKTGLSIFSHVNLALIIWQNLRCRPSCPVPESLTAPRTCWHEDC